MSPPTSTVIHGARIAIYSISGLSIQFLLAHTRTNSQLHALFSLYALDYICSYVPPHTPRTHMTGYYDKDDCFYITDRLKELIKVKGFQVAPAELEAVLLTHPKIADAAVIGVPDERQGESPKAFVVKKEAGLSEREVTEFLASKVRSEGAVLYH